MLNTTAGFTRRALLSSGSAAVGLASAPTFAKVAARAGRPASFRETIDEFADEVLQALPETATSLGVDKGARAGLRAKLSDGSAAGNARLRRIAEFLLLKRSGAKLRADA